MVGTEHVNYIETIMERHFKVKDAYKVFTEELGIRDCMAAGLVHRDYWTLLDRMKEVAMDERRPPKFITEDHLNDFLSRCDDVLRGYIYKFDAYTGRMCIDMEDGCNIEFWLEEVITPEMLANPDEMDKWAPWYRQDLDVIDRVIEEESSCGISESDIRIYDLSSDGEIVLKYKVD